ncbi:helix-turn-helix transcriptional regulator [Streptomyces parvulus]|uniref:winged helix-turn-helix transcriptional regulator n=1 Tax=Streptomyces parvulus TaxID=146923 RepID=UPI001E56BD9A|nr:helix-turn-helix domain-containing protein [Streptomyces parvulus]MCC9157908.1 helix-turn-helix transcriptional regulator [Streptomyces parvulus]MCE7690216.1 helix-turn-helix transcriptional regulator [Streptomyces parvulus]
MSLNVAPTESGSGVRACPIAGTLDVVGDRWSLLVIREISVFGQTRFNAFQKHTGAPRQILAARLKKLEAAGIIERVQYSERPPRHEYRLTGAGEALAPVLRALRTWGEEYLPHMPVSDVDRTPSAR